MDPTLYPTVSPTAPTTATPTVFDGNKVLCGVNTWCYYVRLYPLFGMASETVSITSETDGVASYHEVYITSITDNCVNPAIDLLYEEIDFDYSYEYFDVYDTNDSLIARCDGTQQYGCGIWGQCINNRNLPIEIININRTYGITIYGSSDLHPLCGTYSLNLELTITCNG